MRVRAAEAEMLLGVDVKPSSGIGCWAEWPDDVRDLLRSWNRGSQPRPMKLSFYWHGMFDCADCGLRCEGNLSVAFLNGRWLCDDCLILVARAAREVPDAPRCEKCGRVFGPEPEDCQCTHSSPTGEKP